MLPFFRPPLVRPNRGWLIPDGVPSIDWTNPKTNGLSTLFLPGTITHSLNGGGIGQYQLDNLVQWPTEPVGGTGRGNFVYANNSPILGLSDFGASVVGNGANSGFSNLGADPIQQQPATAVTLLWFGVMSSATAYSLMMGVTYAGGVAPYGCCVLNSDAAGAHQLYFTWNSGGVEGGLTAPVDPSIFDVPVVLIGAVDASGGRLYCNGVLIASGPGLTAPIQYGSANPLQFTNGNNNHDIAYMGAMWGAALSAGDIADLSANPTEFLIYPSDAVMPLVIGDHAFAPPPPIPPPPPTPPAPAPLPSPGSVPTAWGPARSQKAIPAYPYVQYNDDDNIAAFFAAYNQIAQGYLDWFLATPLGAYVYPGISGPLLDWVAEGLYGISRPALPSGRRTVIGPPNTAAPNTISPNTFQIIGNTTYFSTSDDIFKRIITWNFFKGDGQQLTAMWLKRRVMRFLLGTNGTAPNIDNTFPISLQFPSAGNAVITITIVAGSAITLQNAQIFAAAVESNAIALPFQYAFTVNIVS